MKEYIERDSLMKGVDEFHHTSHIQSITRETEKEKTLWKGIHLGVNYCRNHISEAPTADAAPIVHGAWSLESDEEMPNFMFKLVKCSACGEKANHTYNYCPNCGAEMNGGK